MMADQYQGSGPGKTSPRIEQDLLDYDIRNPRRDGTNLLFSPAPIFRAEKSSKYYRKGINDCRHDLWLKPSQTKARSGAQAATTATRDIVSVFCRLCARHFDVVVDYTKRPNRTKPCAGEKETPLHHWQPVRSEEPTESEKNSSTWKYENYAEKHIWSCSAPDCPAVLFIKISPPRLAKNQLVLLEDPKHLYARGQRVISEVAATESERFKDAKPSEPCEAINILRMYLTNALDEKEHRKIMSRNKRFLLAFGDDCKELLEYIGFRYITEIVDDHEEAFWTLPAVPLICEPAVEGVPKGPRHFVEDVLWEVRRSLSNRPAEELIRGKSEVQGTPDSGLQALRIVLGSLKYDKDGRPIDVEATEHPHYAGLGAVGEFADDMILWSYKRQTSCDPSVRNKAYYLECLKSIGTGRNSNFLQEEYVMIASMDEPTLTDIDGAYKFFALNPDVDHGDGHIIGVFKSYIEASPVQRDEAKRALAVIGHARESSQIREVANDKTMTVEEALEFLGVAADTPSDSISAAAVVKAVEGGRSAVGRALSIIGNARGEISLQMEGSHMETEDSEVGLGLDEAYSRLQVHDLNASEESIFAYYKTLIEGAPAGSKSSFANALRVIAAARASSFLFAKLANPDAVVVPQRSTADQPVGLDNIGNTCYLNSLLQYFYTVRNFRDVVMNIEKYRMPLDEGSIKQKRVGGRAVSKGEIIKAQQFVDELHNLYTNLKCASTQSVRPTQDLAELTLLTTEAEANFRRASISSPIGVRAVLAPFTPPPPPPPHSPPPIPIQDKESRTEEKEDDIEMVDAPTQAAMTDEQRGVMPLARRESKGQGVTIAEPQPAQLNSASEVSHTQLDGQAQSEHSSGTTDDDQEMTNGAPLTPPSEEESSVAEKRPPIPPRNKPAPINIAAKSEEDLRKERLSFGAQQDVTEVIGNVLFRMSCAIKPVSIDTANFGEQIDSVRDTFYGSNTLHINKGGTYQKIREDWNNIIVYPAPQGSSSIYDALDVVYDEQMVSLEGSETNAYTTLSKLPPVLHIQIQRTSFDKLLQQAFKNKNQVVFDETIYMDRYLEDEKALLRRKEESKWKCRIRQLETRMASLKAPDNSNDSMSVFEALKGSKDFLEEINADSMEGIEIQSTLTAALGTRASEVTSELEQLEREASDLRRKVREQYTDMRQHRYRLHAVFMHRGTNAYGHYWIYIYDFANDTWREYNDERVSIVDDRKRVFEQSGETTPYYLAYVREEDKENLVDAVVREISDDPLPAASRVALNNSDAMEEDVIEMHGAKHMESYEPQLDLRRSDQEAENGGEDAWKSMQAQKVSQDTVMRS